MAPLFDNKMLKVPLNQICRTCMMQTEEMHPIFECSTGSNALFQVILNVTGLEIEINDKLPTNICGKCKKIANDAYEFKIKSLQVDAALRAMVRHKDSLIKPTNNFDNSVKMEDKTDVKYENVYDEDSCTDMYSCLTTVNDVPDIDDFKNDSLNTLVKTSNDQAEDKIKVEKSNSYCPICGLNIDTDTELNNHILEKHAELLGPRTRGQPKMALAEILSKIKIDNCYLEYSKSRKYDCFLCDKSFMSSVDLAFHMKVHKDTKVSYCTFCKNAFINNQNFEKHLCDKSELQTNYVFENSSDVKHEIVLQDIVLNGEEVNWNKLLICTLCSAIFMSMEKLLEHNDICHPTLSKRCHKCKKGFSTYRAAAFHRALCQNESQVYCCPTCNTKFISEVSLNKHILKQHKGQSVSIKFMNSKPEKRSFSCNVCNKSFYRQQLLNRHSKLHKPNQKVFECDKCKNKYTSKDSLRLHSKYHDPDREKILFTCQYCGRHFSNSSNLIVHMRRHTGEKPYKCDICQKGFPRSSDLLCHRRTHTGEKPCLCTICGKGFSRSNKLSRHMRVHTGQRPYKCIYCEKAFTQSNDLTLHIRRHTGDKPYVCEICGDRFIHGTALQIHRKAQSHFPTTSSDNQDKVGALLEKSSFIKVENIPKNS